MKGKILFLLFFVSLVSLVFGQYPASNGEDNSANWIQRVQLESIDNSTIEEPGGYADYSSGYPANLTASSTADLVVEVAGDGYIFVTAWIDWNQDYDFDDPDEEFLVISGATSGGQYMTVITVPDGISTPVAPTRMRVSYSNGASPPSSGPFPTGEVEDYGINVSSGVAEPCGTWQICLTDSYGDGWNGGNVNVYINGAAYLSGLTIITGYGPECTTFDVNVGDIVSVDYTGGSWSYENEYYILDEGGAEMHREGAGGTTPGDLGDYTVPYGLLACPTCPAPTNLTVTNLTSVTAELGWTEEGTATSWDIEFGASGFAPTETPTNSGVSNPYNYSNLSAGTSYDWYVRAVCSDSDSSGWIGPNTFSTECASNTAFPWTEDFENMFLPECWSKMVNDGNDIIQSYDQFHSDYRSAEFSSMNTAADYNQYLFTGMQLIDAVNTELSFWHRKNSGVNAVFEWGIGTTTNPADYTWNAVALSETDWLPTIVDLSTYSGTDVRVAFHYYNDVTNKVYLDDVAINVPACHSPTSLGTYAIQHTQADLDWVESGTATSWDIELVESGMTPSYYPTAYGVTNPYTYTGLTTGTAYDYYVRSVCGVQDTSEWAGPYTFSTLCDANTAYPWTESFENMFLPNCWSKIVSEENDVTQNMDQNHTLPNGYFSARFSSYNTSSDYNQYLYTGLQQINSLYTELSFWHKKYNTSDELFEWGIATTTNPNDYTWTSVELSESEWQQTKVDLSAYIGQDVYIGFHYYGNYLYHVYLDDVSIDAPTCDMPIEAYAFNILYNQADLGWTETGTATTWDIELIPAMNNPTGVPTLSDIDSIPTTYTGLSSNSSYDWRVRSNCGGIHSDWTAMNNFTTPMNGVSGDVSGIWTFANSPYDVIGDLTVPAGECLTIEPGVEVIFHDSYKLDIYGCINAVGSEEASIIFTADDQVTGWLGINFYNTATQYPSLLSYCTIEYGDKTTTEGNGGGIFAEDCGTNLTIEFSDIRENSANNGGGIFLKNGSDPTITRCRIKSNSASLSGGGIYTLQSSPTIKNVLINQNVAEGNGGGMACTMDSAVLAENVTIDGNTAGAAGGGIYSIGCTVPNNPVINSSIVYNNMPDYDQIHVASGHITVDYSDVYVLGIREVYPGTDNINENPNFLNTINFRLAMMSSDGTGTNPLVDAGDPTADYSNEPFPNGGRINIGMWGGTAYATQTAIVEPESDANGDYNLNLPAVYIFNNPPLIPDGNILLIESGAQIGINFDGFWDFSGILQILDTGGDPVVITPLGTYDDDIGVPPTWSGLRFFPNTMRTPSELNNVLVENALNGITATSHDLIINDTDITYDDESGMGSMGYGLQSNSSPLDLFGCNIVGYNSGISVQNEGIREEIIVDVANTTITAGFELMQGNPGIRLSGLIDSEIDNCDIEDYPYGIVYENLGVRRLRTTPTLTNTRVRNSAESTRTELLVGVSLTGYTGIDIDNCDIEDYLTGINFNNTGIRELATPTLTNTRVRNSAESTREGTVGIVFTGFVAADLFECDIEEFITGIDYQGDGQPFPSQRSTPTLTNTRVRNSAESTREGALGLNLFNLNTVDIMGCDVDGFDTGIEISYDGFRTNSTPTLTNTRVRSSAESTRPATLGLKITGMVAAQLDNCDIEDYTTGIQYTGYGQDFMERSTPTLTNTRVRNSAESTRTGLTGMEFNDLTQILVNTCDIDFYNIGIEINNESIRSLSTPTLTNTRVRNSPESTRTGTIGISVNGFVAADIDNCDVEDYTKGISYVGDGQAFPTRSTPTLTNTRVRNSAESTRTDEKGIVIKDVSEVIVDSCEVEEFDTGIEVVNETFSSNTPTLTNTRVRNSAESTRTSTVGVKLIGDLYALVSGFEITDCDSGMVFMSVNTTEVSYNLIDDLDGSVDELAIYTYGCSDLTVRNNTFYECDTGLYADYSSIWLFSNIIVNTVTSIVENSSTIVSEFNDIAGGYGPTDIDVDPEFSDPAGEDFSLNWYSPCIDTGNPDPLYNDIDGTTSDMGYSCYIQSAVLPTYTLHLISFSPVEIFLDWHHSAGAIGYKVYSSDNPYSGFTEDTTGIYDGTSWTGPVTATKRFYYVIGLNNVEPVRSADTQERSSLKKSQ